MRAVTGSSLTVSLKGLHTVEGFFNSSRQCIYIPCITKMNVLCLP